MFEVGDRVRQLGFRGGKPTGLQGTVLAACPAACPAAYFVRWDSRWGAPATLTDGYFIRWDSGWGAPADAATLELVPKESG